MLPRVAVLIVGYNSRKFLPDLLSSLEKSTYQNFSIFYLQNSTEDGDIDFIKKNFPKVICYTSSKNLGFAGGNNYLAKQALKGPNQKFDALFLLNPDTIVAADCLEKIAGKFSEMTIVQPLILNYDKGKTDLVNTWGNPLHYLGFSYAGGYRESASSVAAKDITLASGAALLVSVPLWTKLGGFAEEFFMYHEDADLSLRARLRGADIVLNPEARVWHKYHFSRNKNKYYYTERNRQLLLLRNFQTRTLLILLSMFLFTEVAMFIFSLMGGFFKEKLRANIDALKMAGKARKFYRDNLVSRRISDKLLYPHLSDSLKFSEIDGLGIRIYNIFSKMYWLLVKNI